MTLTFGFITEGREIVSFTLIGPGSCVSGAQWGPAVLLDLKHSQGFPPIFLSSQFQTSTPPQTNSRRLPHPYTQRHCTVGRLPLQYLRPLPFCQLFPSTFKGAHISRSTKQATVEAPSSQLPSSYCLSSHYSWLKCLPDSTQPTSGHQAHSATKTPRSHQGHHDLSLAKPSC